MNACRLTTRRQAAKEGYSPFTSGIYIRDKAGKMHLERILRDARANNRDHVVVEESACTVTIWEKGYIKSQDSIEEDAEQARQDLLNACNVGYRGISYVH